MAPKQYNYSAKNSTPAVFMGCFELTLVLSEVSRSPENFTPDKVFWSIKWTLDSVQNPALTSLITYSPCL